MTPEKVRAHMAQRQRKIRDAIKQLKRRQRSYTAEKARLEGLLGRLDALESQIAHKPTGRKPTWKGSPGCETVEIVEAMRRQGKSIVAALRLLRRGPPWADWWANLPEADLQTRYDEALKYWGPLFNELKEIERAMPESHVDETPLPNVQRIVRKG